MGTTLISFLFAVGLATWVFQKFQRYSGNNTQQSLTASAVSGVVVFLVVLVIMNMFT